MRGEGRGIRKRGQWDNERRASGRYTARFIFSGEIMHTPGGGGAGEIYRVNDIIQARREIFVRRSDYEVDQTLEQRYLHNGIADTIGTK